MAKVASFQHSFLDFECPGGYLCHACQALGFTDSDVHGLHVPTLRPIIYSDPVRHPPASFLDDTLWLGDLGHATSVSVLRQLGITRVICLCSERVDEHTFPKVHDIDVRTDVVEALDRPNYKILVIVWPAVKKMLTQYLRQGCKVLVCCWGGVNRSGTMVAAWLISETNLSFRDIVMQMMLQRGAVLTNQSFRRALLFFSNTVRHQKGLL